MSQFGGVAVSDAPSAGSASGGSKFGGVAVSSNDNSPGPAAAPAPAGKPSMGSQMLGAVGDEIGGAFGQLGKDWKQATSPFSDTAGAESALGGAAKLPLDALGAAVSPIQGGVRAAMTPVGAGLAASQRTDHPDGYVPPYTDERGKKHPATVVTRDQAHSPEYFKESKIRPRPMFRGTGEEVAGGLTDMAGDIATLAVPGEGAAAEAGGAAARAPRSTFSHLMQGPNLSADKFAQRFAHRALTRDNVTLDEAKTKLAKPGTSISDLGRESTIEAGEQAALKGEGRRLGANLYYDERLTGRRGRVAQAVDKLGNDKNMYEHLDERNQERKTNAGPLYKEAFEGGSYAPLKAQFENEYNEASKRASQLQGELNAAESGITGAHAKHYGANNVYTEASAKEAVGTAEKSRNEIASKLDEANQQKQDSLERLQVAQQHEADGVKGGLWSPRLQEFLDNDKIQAGIREGYGIAKDEALAEGKPFNPKEYGVTGTDENGDPIVSKVPNLRMLDAGKNGLDQILEGYRDKTTGKLVLDKKGAAIEKVRRAYVAELDRLTETANPAYKKAREAWSGPSAVMDAVYKGQDFHKAAPEILQKYTSSLSEAEREGHQIGATRHIADKVAEGPAAALRMAKDIVEDTHYQKQLRAVFGDEKFEHILELAQNEVEYARRGSSILGGSPTGRRNEAAKEFEGLGGAMDEFITAARGGMSGALVGGHRLASRFASQWITERIRGLSDARREQLAKMLFSTDKEENMKAIEQIYKEGTVSVPSGRPSKRQYAPPAIGVASTQNQQ